MPTIYLVRIIYGGESNEGIGVKEDWKCRFFLSAYHTQIIGIQTVFVGQRVGTDLSSDAIRILKSDLNSSWRPRF